MARIRTIKPEFFSHEDMASKSPHARLLALGLLTLADCEGRLRWVPMQVHSQVFPWEASVKIEVLLGELIEVGYVVHYEVEGKRYVHIMNFNKHQRLSGKEATYKSRLPAPPEKTNDLPVGNGETSGSIPGASPGSGGEPLGTGEQGNNRNSISSSKLRFDEWDMEFAKTMFSKILEVAPKEKEPNLPKWANELRLMREQDNRTPAEIDSVFRWANRDTFWRTNVLCPAKLRSQFAALDAKMRNGSTNGKPSKPEKPLPSFKEANAR